MRDGGPVLRVEVAGSPTGSPRAQRDAARVAALLRSLPVKTTTAALRFVDENGPKGGRAMRCSLTIKSPGRPPIHVAEIATTRRGALDAALAKLERRLDRLYGAARDDRRRPRKYFAASRQWSR